MIAEVSWQNWLCYRGEHRLRLDAKAYAVVARRERDADASNWAGKTALLELVRFVLTGQHRFRTEDEFVSRGEQRMAGSLLLDSGHRVERTRQLGKRTSAFFWEPGATEPRSNAEADAAIESLIGLSAEDFDCSCYFAQKRMSKFVTDEPRERQRIVSSWFRLEPLERCEAKVRAIGARGEGRAKEVDGASAELDRREAELRGKLEDGSPAWTPERMDEAEPRMLEAVDRARAASRELEDSVARASRSASAAVLAEQFRAVCEEGKSWRAKLEAADLPALRAKEKDLVAKADEKAAAVRETGEKVASKRRVSLGLFDGACPVAAIACPAKEAINADRAAARSALESAQAEHGAAREAFYPVRDELEVVRSAISSAERIEGRVAALREQARKAKADADSASAEPPAGDPADLRKRLDAAREVLLEADAGLRRLRERRTALAELEARRAALKAERAELSAALGTVREAAAIFGKRGAQRRVAEGALAEIEADANRELRESGVSLSVEARWARETSGLAKACDRCGDPFPPSARAKRCARCGADRGPNLENKLEVVLSDRSGAAEDLGGGHFQLAASRWLRSERGSTWETALVDEPFGALDAANRRAFAGHLATMLPRYGLRQALVVSHSPEVNFVLPGRIEIVAGPAGSTARVVA